MSNLVLCDESNINVLVVAKILKVNKWLQDPKLQDSRRVVGQAKKYSYMLGANSLSIIASVGSQGIKCYLTIYIIISLFLTNGLFSISFKLINEIF